MTNRIEDFDVSTVCAFGSPNLEFGNPVGIIIDEQNRLNPSQRQKIAKELNCSETVFIDDAARGFDSIFNPILPVEFSGHALLGTAWFLYHETNNSPETLTCANRTVFIYQDDFFWIRGPLAITPNWNHVRLRDANEVESLDEKTTQSYKHTVVWAWLDEAKKIIRARTFAPDWCIPEDEANGSGSMQLASQLSSEITVLHGKGSIIHAKPHDAEYVDIGGVCYVL